MALFYYSKAYQPFKDDSKNRFHNSNINNNIYKNKNNIIQTNIKGTNNNIFFNNIPPIDNNFMNIPLSYQSYPMMLNSLPINQLSYPLFYQNYYDQNNFNNSPPQINFNANYPLLFPNEQIDFSEKNQDMVGTDLSANDKEKEIVNDNYYDNFGENYEESIQKGLKDISELYNKNKDNRPKASLLSIYYCNLDRTPEEEMFLNLQIKRLSEQIEKITNKSEDDNGNLEKKENEKKK